MEISLGAAGLLQTLERSGYEAYVVGGCVRDSLLGREPHDWDICTAALPEQTIACFSGLPVLKTGLQHGTVTVLLKEGNRDVPYEITTYRMDGAYTDHRRPDQVEFVRSLREDLARRDFTINAMAYSPSRGLADEFGGRADLREGLIRCVGDPNRRFQEDGLRILRALRFTSTYHFRLEAGTAEALHANRELLHAVAPERVQAELCKLLAGTGVEYVLLSAPEVLAVPIPEIAPMVGFLQKNPYHDRDVWEHTAHAIAGAKPDRIVRLALLFHDIGKPACYSEDASGTGHFYGHAKKSADMTRAIMNRLRFDRGTAARVCDLVALHDTPLLPKSQKVKRWLYRIGEEALRQLIEVQRGDTRGHVAGCQAERLERLDAVERRLNRILEEGQCFQLRDLAVNGRELLAAGIPEGERIGALLNHLMEQVIEETLPNEREALLREALCQFKK